MPGGEQPPPHLFNILAQSRIIPFPLYEFSLPQDIPPGSKVYLIHFDKPLNRARHYLGYSKNDVRRRIQQHRTGKGARLMDAARKNNLSWHVSRTWDGNYELERMLKNQHNASHLCPTCIQERVFEKTVAVVVDGSTGERHPLRRDARIQRSLWDA